MTTESQLTSEPIEEETEEQSDKDRNFAALRKKTDALEARVKELEPLEMDKMIREAGFDPGSDKGKAIGYGLQAQGADAPDDAEGVREFAASEFNWDPTTPLTSEEEERQQAQDRVEGVRKESESDTPPDLDDQIAEAEAAGEYGKSAMLKLQKVAAAGS